MSFAPITSIAIRRNFWPERYPKCFLTKLSGDFLQVSRRLQDARRVDLANAMSPMRILVAGIGNIFFGDDAFGCEVAAELLKRTWPDGVNIVDFGIRAYDLAYAIMDGYDATILIDAAPRGGKPGTVYLLQLDPDKVDTCEDEIADAHAPTPACTLQWIRALGRRPKNLYLVACDR